MVIRLIENTGEETFKYNRNHSHCQPLLNATYFVTKHCTIIFKIGEVVAIMFPFQKFQTNKNSSQEVKVRPFKQWSLRQVSTIANRELLHALLIPYVQECVFFWHLLCNSDKHHNMTERSGEGGGVEGLLIRMCTFWLKQFFFVVNNLNNNKYRVQMMNIWIC